MDSNKTDLNSDSIKWYDEPMQFKTIREAHEWVYSGIYNEIGNQYDGYKCKDSKLAYALLFELIRTNTIIGHRFDVHCDYDHVEDSYVYKVWVSRPKMPHNLD